MTDCPSEKHRMLGEAPNISGSVALGPGGVGGVYSQAAIHTGKMYEIQYSSAYVHISVVI